MELGFMLDHSVVHESFPRWVEGEPAPGAGVPGSLVGKKMRRVARAERCCDCGYVEFYTGDEIIYG